MMTAIVRTSRLTKTVRVTVIPRIELAPDYDTLYLNLARVYVRSGQREKAREILQQLLARKPESTVARRALQELGER